MSEIMTELMSIATANDTLADQHTVSESCRYCSCGAFWPCWQVSLATRYLAALARITELEDKIKQVAEWGGRRAR